MSHNFRLRSSREGPIKSTFGESIRQLAKSYYPYIYSDSRNISKPIVDLQAAFEICTESLEEYERISNEMSSLSYSIFGLEQALHRAITELAIIREEVVDLVTALKTSEKFNLKLLEQLNIIEENLQTGVETSKSILSSNKVTSTSIGLSQDHYMIPKSTRETLESIIEAGKPTVYSSGGVDNVLKEKLSPDMARSHWLIQIQRDLANRHSEFSFLVIGLWSEQVRDNFYLATRKNNLMCGSSPKTSYDNVGKKKNGPNDEENLLRMASSAKIDELPTVVQTIQGRVFELGGVIIEELNRIRAAYEDTKLHHKTLNSELADRKRQLIDSLLATHSAVQTLLDLDERNDALVGKLVKTRPLFADLYRLVQSRSSLDEAKLTVPSHSLADLIGTANWRSFVDQLGKLRVSPNYDATEAD